jgi:hypothetical protein
MQFKLLKFGVRIQQRVFVIKTGDVADVNNAILHSINPATTIRLGV